MGLDIANFVKTDDATAAEVANLIEQSAIVFTPTSVGTMGAMLGAAQPLSLSVSHNTDLIGTLNQDLTVTLTSFDSESSASIIGSQDQTGGHVLAITDGNTTVYPPIPTAPNTPFDVDIHTPDGFNISVSVRGG